MSQTTTKQDFLNDLCARNDKIRQMVQTDFMPLSQAARSSQPEPNEWCVDQCFQHLAQKEQLSVMLDDAVNTDLQARCWFYYVIPVNFGDYLEQFVMHDELHIDQAQRALAAYRQIRMESDA